MRTSSKKSMVNEQIDAEQVRLVGEEGEQLGIVMINEAREKDLRDINNKKDTLNKQIDEEIKKAEKEILDLKKKSPEKINKIAIETSADLIKQLIGIEVNNSSISAIVEDISKKNEGKYYGN